MKCLGNVCMQYLHCPNMLTAEGSHAGSTCKHHDAYSTKANIPDTEVNMQPVSHIGDAMQRLWSKLIVNNQADEFTASACQQHSISNPYFKDYDNIVCVQHSV